METKTQPGYPPIAEQCTWIRVHAARDAAALGLRKLAVQVHPPHSPIKLCVVGMIISLN
jgi:hypothetical protein